MPDEHVAGLAEAHESTLVPDADGWRTLTREDAGGVEALLRALKTQSRSR